MHLDILNQPLTIGDTVIGHRAGSTYAGIIIMTITAFTPKKVRTSYGIYDPGNLVRINEQQQFAKSTYPEYSI